MVAAPISGPAPVGGSHGTELSEHTPTLTKKGRGSGVSQEQLNSIYDSIN